ncbi:hypothetical protein DPMN_107795 [Dreissena polymorpha]|uniref:Uncharacterized protein n=1 Tax=Dreissena polymorpha TaxID=45954 RepID=A0A9D4K7K1_DREPO|nr:hypothetical protein DPMN_107795 [Dreissena polymorpha]
MTACMKEVANEATRFVSIRYEKPVTEEMFNTRQSLWAASVGKSGKAMQSLPSLPPITEAFYANVKRVHIRTCLWKHALDAGLSDLNPRD